MRRTLLKAALAGTTALVAGALAVETVEAGGFAIREQSAQFQGSSFAGSAAGGGLSSMYWNPAALGEAGSGLTSESHFSAIFGQSQMTVDAINGFPPGFVFPGASPNSGDVASPAIVGSSYYAYRLNDRLTLGMSMNSGFGLTTKPRDPFYAGAELGRTTKLFTINATPTLAYQIAPGITIGAGVQVQYARAKLSFALGTPGAPSATFDEADDIAFGATAGILFQPAAGTSIGIGYRSQITHDLEGVFRIPGPDIPNVTAELNLPDIVTLSFRQAIAANMRLLGTIEWSNWSRFQQLVLQGVPGIGPVPANWSDGWYFALGGEYDYSEAITLRAGAGYEISPVDNPTSRFTSIPDADRVWLSAGASVKLTETMSADVAYTHVFIENADFDRIGPLSGLNYTGSAESQVDIISASLKMRWGASPPLEPLK
ncbi:MAG: OmpP1/FadL family transporter [Hyphomicrobiaceae bacterium]